MLNETSIALLISALTLASGIYSGVSAVKRSARADNRKESAEMTMVIVKLEGISEGISEIKTDLSHVKGDIKEITERLIVAEQSVRLAHRRLDELQRGNEKGGTDENRRK